jgi:hypothetical protein
VIGGLFWFAAEYIKLGIVDFTAHIEGSHHAVKYIFLRVACPLAYLSLRNPFCMFECIRHPNHEGNIFLDVRSDRIWRAMQVQAIFTQRLNVVRDVHQHGGGLGKGFQQVYGSLKEIVGVQNGIVIRIYQFLGCTLMQFNGLANRLEHLELFRVFGVIGRTMATSLMENDKDFFICR